MKFSPATESAAPAADPGHIKLPQGLVGLPEYKSCEILTAPDQAPFLWLRLHGPTPLHFVLIEPGGLIADYEPELFDEDAAALGIADPADATLFNIVTLHSGQPNSATVNLSGPLVVNRRTGIARQCILANYSRYSAHHPLLSHA